MLGEVVATLDNFIEEQVRSLKAVLESVANQDKIFIPPLPPGSCLVAAAKSLYTHPTQDHSRTVH